MTDPKRELYSSGVREHLFGALRELGALYRQAADEWIELLETKGAGKLETEKARERRNAFEEAQRIVIGILEPILRSTPGVGSLMEIEDFLLTCKSSWEQRLWRARRWRLEDEKGIGPGGSIIPAEYRGYLVYRSRMHESELEMVVQDFNDLADEVAFWRRSPSFMARVAARQINEIRPGKKKARKKKTPGAATPRA